MTPKIPSGYDVVILHFRRDPQLWEKGEVEGEAGGIRMIWYPMCVHLFYTYKRNHPPSALSPPNSLFLQTLKN